MSARKIIFTYCRNTVIIKKRYCCRISPCRSTDLHTFCWYCDWRQNSLSIQSSVSLYLKFSENGGNVRLVGQVGENLQLQKKINKLINCKSQRVGAEQQEDRGKYFLHSIRSCFTKSVNKVTVFQYSNHWCLATFSSFHFLPGLTSAAEIR